jgi:hypothetical protein
MVEIGKKGENPASLLASVFEGGRISGWVERNREAIKAGRTEEVELDSLERLCPSLAERTRKMSADGKVQLIQEALSLTEESPLSATHYQPTELGSPILVRK